jgi:hypothetical protein
LRRSRHALHCRRWDAFWLLLVLQWRRYVPVGAFLSLLWHRRRSPGKPGAKQRGRRDDQQWGRFVRRSKPMASLDRSYPRGELCPRGVGTFPRWGEASSHKVARSGGPGEPPPRSGGCPTFSGGPSPRVFGTLSRVGKALSPRFGTLSRRGRPSPRDLELSPFEGYLPRPGERGSHNRPEGSRPDFKAAT